MADMTPDEVNAVVALDRAKLRIEQVQRDLDLAIKDALLAMQSLQRVITARQVKEG